MTPDPTPPPTPPAQTPPPAAPPPFPAADPFPRPANAVPAARAAQPATGLVIEPMDGTPDFGRVFESLLRRPGRILHALAGGSTEVAVRVGVLCLAGLALFGILLGFFSGGVQLWAAPLKVVLGVAASALICLPSFYIFLCLGGASVRLKDAVGLLATGLGLASLLLMALAPVVWLFTQATESAAFMGALALGFWLIAIGFGLRLILRGARLAGTSGAGLLSVWALIFLIVTLQMSTTLRPILGKADSLLPTERRFFLEHWVFCLGGQAG